MVKASGGTGDGSVLFWLHTLEVGLFKVPSYEEQGLGLVCFKDIGGIDTIYRASFTCT